MILKLGLLTDGGTSLNLSWKYACILINIFLYVLIYIKGRQKEGMPLFSTSIQNHCEN